jgi:hypothetical protein
MSTISAGTSSGTALVTSGDTTGQLVLQTNGTTTAVTIGTNQVVTLAQPLPVASGGTGATSLTANNILLGNGTSAVQVVAPGTAGNVLTSNGTTWQSTAPAPSSGSVTATASGSISSNAPVVVNTDGTVSQVATSSVAFSTGSLASTGSRATSQNDSCSVYHPQQDKLVYIFKENSTGNLVAYAGTVSGTSITWGSQQVIATSGAGGDYFYSSAVYCPTTNRIYLTATFDNVNGRADLWVLSLNDTTITVTGNRTFWIQSGSSTPFGSRFSSCYDAFNDRIVVTWTDASQNGFIRVAVPTAVNAFSSWTGSQLGTNISVTQCIYDPSRRRIVILISDTSLGNWGRSLVADVATNTLGSRDTFYSSSTAGYFNGCYVSDQQVICVVFYNNAGTAVRAVAGYTSGTTMSWDTTVAGFAGFAFNFQTAYNPSLGLQSVGCVYTTSNTVRFVPLTVSGTTPTFGSSNQVVTTTSASVDSLTSYGSTFIPQIYSNSVGATYFNYGVVVTPAQTQSTMTSENFIGFSSASYTNGQTATIRTVGSTSTQSGLTPAQAYYVQRGGTLSTVPDSPSVFAGTALSTTSLIIKG